MTPADVRARPLAALEADLVGPFAAGTPGIDPAEAWASDETLTLAPSRWYLTGFLAPQGARGPDPDDLLARAVHRGPTTTSACSRCCSAPQRVGGRPQHEPAQPVVSTGGGAAEEAKHAAKPVAKPPKKPKKRPDPGGESCGQGRLF